MCSPRQDFHQQDSFSFQNQSSQIQDTVNPRFFQGHTMVSEVPPCFQWGHFFRKSPIPKLDSLHLDARLSGLGANWNHRVYSYLYLISL